MKLPDPDAVPSQLANSILERQDWARERLAPFAGQAFCLRVGPFSSAFAIDPQGLLTAAPTDAAASLTLTLSPLTLPAFLADPARWNEFVHEDGDAELGGALKDLAHTLPWFVEEAFAKALGPLFGQRAADAGRGLLAMPEYAVHRVADSVMSYARDEADLLAHGEHLRTFADACRDLETRTNIAEERLAALASQVGPRLV